MGDMRFEDSYGTTKNRANGYKVRLKRREKGKEKVKKKGK